MNTNDLKSLTEGMERVYTFVSDCNDLYSAAKDYGNGDKMNMAEIHTLSLISDNPGISVSGVSKMWNRTLSAASQNINKLAKKNLIKKKTAIIKQFIFMLPKTGKSFPICTKHTTERNCQRLLKLC